VRTPQKPVVIDCSVLFGSIPGHPSPRFQDMHKEWWDNSPSGFWWVLISLVADLRYHGQLKASGNGKSSRPFPASSSLPISLLRHDHEYEHENDLGHHHHHSSSLSIIINFGSRSEESALPRQRLIGG